MFWSSQMLSFAELTAGSIESTLTAFAITRVSTPAFADEPVRVAANAAPATTSVTRPPSRTSRAVEPNHLVHRCLS
jgi:hypothetical protein